MSGATIRVEGVKELTAKLGHIATLATLEPAMHKAVAWLEADIKPYPPQRSGSKYIRGYGFAGKPATSENLGQSWTTQVTRDGEKLTGSVGTKVTYAPLVQSMRLQTRQHKLTGWQTDAQVIEANRAVIVQEFKNAIARELA
jgi:hypothetical protein